MNGSVEDESFVLLEATRAAWAESRMSGMHVETRGHRGNLNGQVSHRGAMNGQVSYDELARQASAEARASGPRLISQPCERPLME